MAKSNSKIENIVTTDLTEFPDFKNNNEVFVYFLKNVTNKVNMFQFSDGKKEQQDDREIIKLNSSNGKWYAGRYVGEAKFQFKNITYNINIKPRYGILNFYRMLEEVFNFKFIDSKTSKIDKDFQILIKKFISLLWLFTISKANKHGLPKSNVWKSYTGHKVKGRIDIRRSINTIAIGKLRSNYREKLLNQDILQILSQAYYTLTRNYGLTENRISENAREVIENLFSFVDHKSITHNDYKGIKYNDIYIAFKPAVDLSWKIIKNKNLGILNQQDSKEGFGLFVDMAEIWELYIKSILRKSLSKTGWQIKPNKFKVYSDKLFYTTIIPDIVFKKNNNILMFDAKYKHMEFTHYDFDQPDFFQAHTYINYLQQYHEVIMGGLLYPITKDLDPIPMEKLRADTLYSSEKGNTKYIIDGIDMSRINDNNGDEPLFSIEVNNFLNRINSLIAV